MRIWFPDLGQWAALAFVFLGAVVGLGIQSLGARGEVAASDSKDKPFVVEYYYKTKWGHADEFLALFKKNHLPLLRKEMELGRILSVAIVAPRYHNTEDGRWDYRVTLVFKNGTIATDDFDSSPLKKELFPDQETFKREEQRRFEILDAHWDLPIKDVDPDKP